MIAPQPSTQSAPPPGPRRSAWMIAALYVLSAVVWIITTDRLLAGLQEMGWGPVFFLHTFKGLIFVAITAVLLYLLIARSLRRQEAFANELTAARERYELAMSGSAEGIWDWDIVHDQLFASPKLEQILGYTPGEMISSSARWSARLHPEDRDRVLERLRAHLERGEAYDVIYRMKVKNEEYRWFQARGVAARDSEGRAVRMAGSLEDVHERVEAQRALRESEEQLRESELRFRQIAGAVEQSFWMMDVITGKMLYASPVYERIFGQPVQTLLDNPMAGLDAIHAEDRERVRARFAAWISDPVRNEFREQFRVIWPDGTVRWVQEHGSVVSLENGRVTRAAGAAQDITERMEGERLQREAAERYRQMFHTNQAIKFVVDPATGEIVDANEAAAEFYGYPREKLMSKTVFDLNTLPRVTVLDALARATHEAQTRFEFEHRTLTGQVRDVEVYSGPVTINGRRLFFSIVHDITDRKRAEAALRQSEATNWALLSAIPDAMFVYSRETGKLRSLAGERGMLDGAETLWPLGNDERLSGITRGHLATLFESDTPQGFEYEQSGGKEGGKTTWEVRMVKSTPEEALLLVRNITARVEAERKLVESDQRLALLVERTPLGVVMWDRDFRITAWNPAADKMFGYAAAEVLGKSLEFLIAPEDVKYVQDLVQNLLKNTGRGLRGTNRNIHKSGRLLYCEWYNTPLVDAGGRVIGVASIVEDVTERKRLQQRQQMMVSELDHRVKNNLAAIMSIAEQTGRASRDYRDFMEAFNGRLRAMARMHNAMAGSMSDGAELRTLVRQTLESFGSTTASRISVDGPTVMLDGRAAQALAMALYELGTNAIKYGALSRAEGRIEVAWSMVRPGTSGAQEIGKREESTKEDWLHLVWREQGGPEVHPPARRGFGSELIQGTIAYELGGSVRVEFEPAGVVCAIRTPLGLEERPEGGRNREGVEENGGEEGTGNAAIAGTGQ